VSEDRALERRERIRQKRIRKKRIIIAAVLLVAIYVFCSFVSAEIRLRGYKAQIKELEEMIEQKNLEAEAIKLEEENRSTDEYIEKTARERLGMVYPNERLFINSGEN